MAALQSTSCYIPFWRAFVCQYRGTSSRVSHSLFKNPFIPYRRPCLTCTNDLLLMIRRNVWMAPSCCRCCSPQRIAANAKTLIKRIIGRRPMLYDSWPIIQDTYFRPPFMTSCCQFVSLSFPFTNNNYVKAYFMLIRFLVKK